VRGVLVTGTGTGVGKTFVARGLARALVRSGVSVAAVKPLETGVGEGGPRDALALAAACGRPELARAPGLYRAEAALAPYAVSLEGGPPVPTAQMLAGLVAALTADADLTIVEGAGGLLVPLGARETTADLAALLALPLLVVAPDSLGVLSHVLTLVESAEKRRLRVGAIVLRLLPTAARDGTERTNARILAEHTGAPVVGFAPSDDDDDALAARATAADLPSLVRRLVRAP